MAPEYPVSSIHYDLDESSGYWLAKSPIPVDLAHTLCVMLADKDLAVLDFERTWWRYPEPKDRAIREYLGMSATRYYQVLRRLIDDPVAESVDPLTVRRLRKVRDRAKEGRITRRLPNGTPVS